MWYCLKYYNDGVVILWHCVNYYNFGVVILWYCLKYYNDGVAILCILWRILYRLFNACVIIVVEQHMDIYISTVPPPRNADFIVVVD